MCVENIPSRRALPWTLPSFTHGELYMTAQDRVICNNARDVCACFLGTYDTVVCVVPTEELISAPSPRFDVSLAPLQRTMFGIIVKTERSSSPPSCTDLL
jgi:hypothetical protein